MTNVALALLGVVTGALAARLLGPQGRGELAAIQLLPTLLSGLAMLGLVEAVTYYVARDTSKASVTIATGLSTAFASAAIFVVIGQFFVSGILTDYSEAVRFAAAVYLLYLLVHALFGIPHQALRGMGEFTIWNGLRCAPNIVWLSVLVSAYFIGVRRADSLAMFFLVASFVLSGVVLLIACLRTRGSVRFEAAKARDLLTFGFPTVIGVVPQILSSRLDQVLVAATLPASALGSYAVAVAWGGIAHPLVGAIGAVILPTIAGRPDAASRRRILGISTRTSVLVVIILVALIVPLTPVALPLLFGASFAAAVPAAEILIFASSLTALNVVIVEGFRGHGLPVAGMRSDIAGAVIAVVAGLILVERFGVIGAACTALAAAIAVTTMLLVQAYRMLGIPPWELVVPRLTEFRLLLRRGIEALSGRV